MPETRTLTLQFRVESDDELTSTEFLSLFSCIDPFGRAIAENETFRFLETLELPDEYRLQLFESILTVGREIPTPAEIRSVDRGSWSVTAVLSGLAILWIAQKFIGSPILRGWDESMARERLMTFFRDRVFGGSKQVIERRAAEGPTFGNLKVAAVEEVRSAPGEPHVLIRLKRTEVVEVESSDQQLIENFLRRLAAC
jgi:hypothetical protein